MESWIQPAVIISVIVAVNAITMFLTNKRIDDLRFQMMKDHQNLDNHLTRVEYKLDEHIANYSIHSRPTE